MDKITRDILIEVLTEHSTQSAVMSALSKVVALTVLSDPNKAENKSLQTQIAKIESRLEHREAQIAEKIANLRSLSVE
jgi:hypothetical protein